MRDNETMENLERTENPFGDLEDRARVSRTKEGEEEEQKPLFNREMALQGGRIEKAHARLEEMYASIDNIDEDEQAQ